MQITVTLSLSGFKRTARFHDISQTREWGSSLDQIALLGLLENLSQITIRSVSTAQKIMSHSACSTL